MWIIRRWRRLRLRDRAQARLSSPRANATFIGTACGVAEAAPLPFIGEKGIHVIDRPFSGLCDFVDSEWACSCRGAARQGRVEELVQLM